MGLALGLLFMAIGGAVGIFGLGALWHAADLWRASAWSAPPWPVVSAGCLALLAGERMIVLGAKLMPD